MAKRSTKPVGEVVAVPRWPGKFMVRVTRYPSGRKLPEPRVLLDEASVRQLTVAMLAWLHTGDRS